MTIWKKSKKGNKKKCEEPFSTITEGLTTGSSPGLPPSSVAAELDAEKKKMEDSINQDINSKMASNFSSPEEVGTKLGSEVSSILDGITSITNGNSFYSSLENAFKPPEQDTSVYGNMNLNYLDLKGVSKTIGLMFSEMSQLIKYFFSLLFSYLILLKKSIQLFIIQFNENLSIVLTKVANSLTQNTATESEITTFKEQTQKFLMLLMVWIFVYNWYYVAFYLKTRDNIRYTLNADYLYNYSNLLYGMFGPGCRVVEKFNSILIGTAERIQKYVYNNVIYILLFILFMVLVAANLQYVLLVDFINAWNHKFGTSIISAFAIVVAFYYALKYYFFESGMGSLLTFEYPWFFGYPVFFVMLFFYAAWTIGVSIPLGILFVFAYLVLYSFFGVLFYQGTNTFNTFTGISENIAKLGPNLAWHDPCVNPPIFQFNKIHLYLYHYGTKIADWGTAYMFEIVMILLLLGGIGIYLKGFQSSIASKFSASAMSPSSLSQAFKYLFTWLILINVLIIGLLITWAIQKYNYIQYEMPSKADKTPIPPIPVPPSTAMFEGNEFIEKPSSVDLPIPTTDEPPVPGLSSLFVKNPE